MKVIANTGSLSEETSEQASLITFTLRKKYIIVCFVIEKPMSFFNSQHFKRFLEARSEFFCEW